MNFCTLRGNGDESKDINLGSEGGRAIRKKHT